MADGKRRANATTRVWRPEPKDPTRIYRWTWEPHHRALLQPFSPGKSGLLGGEQKLVNRLWGQTDEAGGCWVDAADFLRCQHYCLHYGSGGPNDLMRAIIVPTFRRVFSIELAWPMPGQQAMEPERD